jgi:hypothetical protein
MVWIPRWKSPKRKEDHDNAVRRALLAGAFAAGASGLLTRKALADTPYTSFAYPLSSLPSMRQATATRTSAQRFADVFNVKDFGALGNNSHDDTAAIQAAIDAALDNWGGVVYFPPGAYKITRRLEAGTAAHGGVNNGANLTFLGTCNHQANGSGSVIQGNFHDYLLYLSARGQVAKTIQGLGFKNVAQFTFNSAEAPGNPDNLRTGGWLQPDPLPASALDGGGCVYAGEGLSTAFTVINCEFLNTSGIGLYLGCYCSTIIGSRFTGGGDSGNTGSSIGIASAGAFELHACKMYSYGTCIAIFQSAGIDVTSLNLEVSGIGIRLGANPVGFWNSNPPNFHPAWTNGGCNGAHLRNLVTESCASAGLEVDSCYMLMVENCSFASYGQGGNPPSAIWIGWSTSAKFTNVQVSGVYTNTGIDVCSGPNGQIGNMVFENVNAAANHPDGTSIPAWKLPPVNAYDPGKHPVAYINCNTDGAVPLSQLPTGMEFASGHPVMITDSTVPLWTGTASNVGRPAVGGGTNKVLVRWNPLSARWVLAG